MRDSQEDRQQDERVGERDPPPRVAEDQFYQALASSQRRRLLYYLLSEEESTVEELATVLSEWEATTTGTMNTADQRSGLRLTLVHSHLPILAEADLIDYDSDAGSVEIASLHHWVEAIIQQSVEAEQPTES